MNVAMQLRGSHLEVRWIKNAAVVAKVRPCLERVVEHADETTGTYATGEPIETAHERRGHGQDADLGTQRTQRRASVVSRIDDLRRLAALCSVPDKGADT